MTSGAPSRKTKRVPTASWKRAAAALNAACVKPRVPACGASIQTNSPGEEPSFTLSGGTSPSVLISFRKAWARTTPATVLRSAMPMPVWPRASAVSTRSRAWEAPRRKEKLVWVASSA